MEDKSKSNNSEKNKSDTPIESEKNEKPKNGIPKQAVDESGDFIKFQKSNPFNGINNINGLNNLNGINDFNPFSFNNTINNTLTNSLDIFQAQNFENNSNFNNINIINNDNTFPLININGINNINNLENKKNSNHIFISQNQNFNINSFDNLQNNLNNKMNNMNNNNKINNVIFTNFNMSSHSEENKFQNNITNINNINIENLIQNFSSGFNKFNTQNHNLNHNHNHNGINIINNNNNSIFDEIEQVFKNSNKKNTEYNIKDEFYLSSEKMNHKNLNQKNKKINPSTFYGHKKTNGKKKYNLFKNNQNINKENIKEKDIRDFKRFCEGLKCSLPEYICSQIGSRIMQKYLNRFPPFIITNLIEKIYMNFEKIMSDIYGNYFCQKLYIISTIEQRRMILNSIKDIFINVSKTSAGAHVTQSIIEESSTKDEKVIIMEYIKGHEMELALHPEGTHVLQKIIQIFPENERQNLTDVLCTNINVNILCQDLKGISVIKRLISFNTEKANRIKLVESFFGNCLEISKSSSGSYIIQYLLEQWGVDIGLKLILFCVTNFESFAISKHSANLIDKIILICLKRYSIIRYFGNDQNMNLINNEIIIINALKNIILESNKIMNIYKNKYGKDLIIKIRKLFTIEENEKLYLFIKSLETLPNYLESKKYKMYIEIYKSQ